MRKNESSHLESVQLSYWGHLFRAWSIALVLFVHGLFPNVWKQKASQMMNNIQHAREE